jgi:drug/metabolite transporter (DMT)-like permease
MISKGVGYMLISVVFFSLMNLSVKYLKHINSFEIVFFRSLFTLVISYYFIKKNNLPVLGNNKLLLILRGVFGSIALLLFFFTVQKIPLASAVTIQYTSPIFTAIFAIFILKEKMKLWQWLFFAISFSGIIMIKGFDERVSLTMLLCGIGSAFFSGLAYNVVRKLKDFDHPLTVIFYFPLITLPLISPYVFLNWQMPQGIDWLLLLFVGICTQIAQLYMTKAYQAETVDAVSGIIYLGIVFALSFGYLFFDEVFELPAIIGMVLVVVGVILNLVYKSRTRKLELKNQ